MKAVLFAVSLLLVAAAAQARDLKSDIEAANQKWIATYAKGDAAGLAALYTDAATVLPAGGEMVKGRAAIQKLFEAAIQSGFKITALQTISVEKHGDMAHEIGRFVGQVPNAQKQQIPVEGKYVVLWRQVKGTWKLDTDIWNANQ
jgi:uncharacterized protein (TIGR02246 family)